MPKATPTNDDGSSSLFFLLAILVCVIAPWTMNLLWWFLFPGRQEVEAKFPTVTDDGMRVRQCQTQAMAAKRGAEIQNLKSRRRALTGGFVFRCLILLLLWCWTIYISLSIRQAMATSATYQNFDPYEILEVGRSSSTASIKKAFRQLSLKWHPDKNPDKEATQKFMLIKKAYDALTDPVAKRNYAKYGNPDGPSRIELGMAVPSFSKEHQNVVLILFVIFFILGLPLTMLYWMSSSVSAVCPNGVCRSTMEALAAGVAREFDVSAALALLLDSDESRAIPERPEDAADVAAIALALGIAAQKSKANGSGGTTPAIPSKAAVLWAVHTRREHGRLNSVLAADLEAVLRPWRTIVMAMAELASKKGLNNALEVALELHRCLLQGVEPVGPGNGVVSLLQVPHLDAERVKLWRKGSRKAGDVVSLCALPLDELKSSMASLNFTEQEFIDVSEFVSVFPQISIVKTEVSVTGEDSICQGDIATLEVSLRRGDLREGEAAGAAHAPLFPDASVVEAWWLILAKATPRGGTTVVQLKRLKNLARDVTTRLKFGVPLVGKNRLKLSLVCEAYVGLDVQQDISFEAKSPPEGVGDGSDDDGDGEED